ncbi:integrase, partial [Salmonella enterica subsp. enterica]|nr:integrase [Salmonella enterica subsp. enterica]
MHKLSLGSKKHRVPLSDAVFALLKGLPRLKVNNHVFPAPRAETLSDMSLLAVLKR